MTGGDRWWARLVYRTYGLLPRRLQWLAVQTVAPSYVLGVACVVERDDGRVLMVRTAYRTRWVLPGGMAGRRERAAASAVREAREETGLDVVVTGEPGVVVEPRRHRVELIFPAVPAPGADPDDLLGSTAEIEQVGWFAWDDLPRVMNHAAAAITAFERVHGRRASRR